MNRDLFSTRESRNRAVSNVIGFTLIVGLAVATIGAFAIISGDVLSEKKGEDAVRAAQSDMLDLRTSLNAHGDGSPFRQTTMGSGRGRFGFADEVEISFNIDTDLDGTLDTDIPSGGGRIPTRAMTFTVERDENIDTTLRYVSGSVMRYESNAEQGFVERPPPFQITNERAIFVVPSIEADPDSQSSVGIATGSSTFSVSSTLEGVETTREVGITAAGGSGAMDSEIIIHDPMYPGVWEQYFEDSSSYDSVTVSDTDGSGEDDVVATFNAKTVFIKRVNIEVNIEGDDT